MVLVQQVDAIRAQSLERALHRGTDVRWDAASAAPRRACDTRPTFRRLLRAAQSRDAPPDSKPSATVSSESAARRLLAPRAAHSRLPPIESPPDIQLTEGLHDRTSRRDERDQLLGGSPG
jgi:hypothetical protein